jgi:Ca2+:H+ antiporter
VLGATWGRELASVLAVVVALILAGAVLAAVHHAEVVAHRVGEPFGSLVLAVAVTVIEVALTLRRSLPSALIRRRARRVAVPVAASLPRGRACRRRARPHGTSVEPR